MTPVTRRGFLQASLGGALGYGLPGLGSALGSAPAFAVDGAAVDTAAGRIRGGVESGVHVFRGIPYGASTAGEARFRKPAPPQPWSGVRDALRYGPSCPQPSRGTSGSGSGRPSPLVHLFTPATMPSEAQTPLGASEDCLMLNVWSSGLEDGEKRPVLVWLHGGGFTTGSGSSLLYDGVNLCQRGDVVLVTVNHRLGALGYLYLDELDGERFAGSGNAGMLDLVQALAWVRDNIERFGGDPSRVTIFGESGGGRKVSTLMAMPAARGLFHRAIIQSGPGVHMEPADHAREMTLALLDELELRPDQLSELQSLSVERLLAAQVTVSARQDAQGRSKGVYSQRGFGPTVEGDVLPDYAFDPAAPEVSATVPLLIGTNTHELALFLQGDDAVWNRSLTEEQLLARVEVMAGSASERVMRVYRREYPQASPTERLLLMISDRTYRFDSQTLAQRKAAQHDRGGAPVYMYLFAWQTPALDGRLHAAHALEIPFVFDNVGRFPNIAPGRDEAAELASRMADAWIAFATRGEPGHAGLPEWPRYGLDARATMVFDGECRVENDPNQAVRRLWATL